MASKWLPTCALVLLTGLALVAAAGATPPAPATITVTALDETHDQFTATGGAFGSGVTGIGFLPSDPRFTENHGKSGTGPIGTTHIVEVFTTAAGNSFTMDEQLLSRLTQYDPVTDTGTVTSVGNATITSGTGAYRKLHGTFSVTETLHFASGQALDAVLDYVGAVNVD